MTMGRHRGSTWRLDTEGHWQTIRYRVALYPSRWRGKTIRYDPRVLRSPKNILTVGSIRLNEGEKTPVISTFSSRGPTDDGRIKPDLVSLGEGLYSSISTAANAYGRFTGTSMATPTVAGSLALLQQLAFNQQKKSLRSATLKGLALHTARDLGPPGPDYTYGWGLLDVHHAALLLEDAYRSPSLIQELALAANDTLTLDLFVDQKGPLRITINWTDPSGEFLRLPNDQVLNSRVPMLVNDLDIRLQQQASGSVYFPVHPISRRAGRTRCKRR